MTHRKHDRAFGQFDALNWNIRWRPHRQDVVAAECHCERKGRLVFDLDDRVAATIGNAPHALHCVARGHPQTRFKDGSVVDTTLANSRLLRWHMPTIVGSNEPLERRFIAVTPRLNDASSADSGAPMAAQDTNCVHLDLTDLALNAALHEQSHGVSG